MTEENEYTVSCDISVHAKDEWDAAKQAHSIIAECVKHGIYHVDPNNTPLYFRVLHLISGREFVLDLDTGTVVSENS